MRKPFTPEHPLPFKGVADIQAGFVLRCIFVKYRISIIVILGFQQPQIDSFKVLGVSNAAAVFGIQAIYGNHILPVPCTPVDMVSGFVHPFFKAYIGLLILATVIVHPEITTIIDFRL